MEIKIEKGIPIPTVRAGGSNGRVGRWEGVIGAIMAMKLKESIHIPVSEISECYRTPTKVSSFISWLTLKPRKALGRRFASRTMVDTNGAFTGVRIWRVE